MNDHTLVKSFSDDKNFIFTAFYNSIGTLIVSGGKDKKVKIWDV